MNYERSKGLKRVRKFKIRIITKIAIINSDFSMLLTEISREVAKLLLLRRLRNNWIKTRWMTFSHL